jgi:hypothetical protein
MSVSLLKGVQMFAWLRKNREQRQQVKQRADFERAAAESDPALVADTRRARDLPDQLGDFNEMTRMGPTIGTSGGGSGT